MSSRTHKMPFRCLV